ncbi:2-dehydropantoate 2-reductase [bacterium]|nr:2-dehydropantoate 2-reductase [bacterium]
MDRPVALIGAGGVGSLLVGALLHNGLSFQWVVRNPARRKQLDRLHLLAGNDALEYGLERVELLGEASGLGAVDWLILAVKAQQAGPLLDKLKPGPSTRVLLVANGLHERDVHLGLLYGGVLLDQGRLVTGEDNELVIGPLGKCADESGELADMLEAPFLHCTLKSSIQEAMWNKLALNCVVNPLSALLDCINGALLLHLETPLVQGILREVHALIEAESPGREPLSLESLAGGLRDLLVSTAGNSSSMREDLAAGRETEIEMLNLAIARVGKRHGVPCPINESLGCIVRSISNGGGL